MSTTAATPAASSNPVGKIDAQLADLGDLEDLHARMLHARQLEERAKQSTHDYTREHLDGILADLEPLAQATVDQVVAAMANLHTAADAYLALAGRVNGLKGTVRERQSERVLALDVGSDLVRQSKDYLAPPLPTEIR